MPNEWDWPPDGRSISQTEPDNVTSPASRLVRLASKGYVKAIFGAIAVLIIIGAGWFIWTAMSLPNH